MIQAVAMIAPITEKKVISNWEPTVRAGCMKVTVMIARKGVGPRKLATGRIKVMSAERYNAAMKRRWRLRTRFESWFLNFLQREGVGGGGGAKGTELLLFIDSVDME